MAHLFHRSSIFVRVVDNGRGVAIFAAILVLMLLSIVMVASTNTTITEKRQVRSEAIFERSFYLSESSALEAIQKLANETTPDELLAPLIKSGANNEDLLVSADKEEPENDLLNLDSNNDGTIDHQDHFDTSEIDPNSDTYRVAVQMPIVGSSLGLETSRLYSYMSYGYTEANGGRAMVKVGYKKRF